MSICLIEKSRSSNKTHVEAYTTCRNGGDGILLEGAGKQPGAWGKFRFLPMTQGAIIPDAFFMKLCIAACVIPAKRVTDV